MILPEQAAPRPDLDFLTHRTRRVAASAGPPKQAATSAGLDLSTPQAAAARPAPSAGLDLSTPSGSLDLSTPSGALDLSTPPAGAARPTPSAGPDRSTPPAPAAPQQRPSGGPARPVRRAAPGERTLLNPRSPVVTLNRLQSGIGVLTFEAAIGDSVGDLRLGCAYQVRSGQSALVSQALGIPSAPPNSRAPLIVARHDRYDRISIDLRRSREIERFMVFGFSPTRQVINHGGTLVVLPAGGARIELALERPPSAGISVFTSTYNVDGELVLRAEMEIIAGSLREACRAYGYDRITWLNDDTPLE